MRLITNDQNELALRRVRRGVKLHKRYADRDWVYRFITWGDGGHLIVWANIRSNDESGYVQETTVQRYLHLSAAQMVAYGFACRPGTDSVRREHINRAWESVIFTELQPPSNQHRHSTPIDRKYARAIGKQGFWTQLARPLFLGLSRWLLKRRLRAA